MMLGPLAQLLSFSEVRVRVVIEDEADEVRDD